MAENRHAKNNERRKQCRTRGEPVQTINQVEGVGNSNDPEDREWKSEHPTELPGTEQHGQVQNPETSDKQHGGSNAFNNELKIRADRVHVVIEAEQEHHCPSYKNRQEDPDWSAKA